VLGLVAQAGSLATHSLHGYKEKIGLKHMVATSLGQTNQQVWEMQEMEAIEHRDGMIVLFVTRLQWGFWKDKLPCMSHGQFGYNSIVFLDTVQQIFEHTVQYNS